MTAATVEANVIKVFRLPVFILTVSNTRDAVRLNFGDLNPRDSYYM